MLKMVPTATLATVWKIDPSVPAVFYTLRAKSNDGGVYTKLCHFGHPRPLLGAPASTALEIGRRYNGRVANELCHR